MPAEDLHDVLAEVCQEQSEVFLRWRSDDATDGALAGRACVADGDEWGATFGDRETAGRLHGLVLGYLSEASHQLVAMPTLLREFQVHATLEPLIRAIIERCGRVCWLLDPTVVPLTRAWRTELEVGACGDQYAAALKLDRAPSDIRADHRRQRKAHQALVLRRFGPDTHGFEREMAKWTVQGKGYPSYSEIASFALDHDSSSSAAYAALSGFAHPNIFFVDVRQHQTMSLPHAKFIDDRPIEQKFRLALAAHFNAVERWAGYYLDPADCTVIAQIGVQLEQRLDGVSTLPTDLRSDDGEPA